MALLQIAEPGQSSLPHQHKLAVGIDLGTTNSLVASVQSGLPTILKDMDEHKLVPSIVYYGKNETKVGHEALPYLSTDAKNTIVSVKRFMGHAGDLQSHLLTSKSNPVMRENYLASSPSLAFENFIPANSPMNPPMIV